MIRPLSQLRTLPSLVPKSGGLTPVQAELRQYAGPITQQKITERRRIKPLQWIFDILQRGQYMSANVAEQLIEGDTNLGKILNAAWQGITGEKKGSYQALAKEHLPASLQKPIVKAWEGKPIIGASPADILGFLGDVFLDPTTYLGFGVSKGARAAADDFMVDAVRLHLQELGQKGGLKALVKKGVNHEAGLKLLGQNVEAGIKWFRKNGGKDLAREINRYARQARKHALRTPGETLRNEIGKRIDDLYKGYAGQLAAKTPKGALKASQGLKPQFEFLNRIMDKLGKKAYREGGERAVTLGLGPGFGKEIFKSVRDPNIVSKSLINFGNRITSKVGGSKLGDAVWSIMNSGPIAQARRAIGIKNPYEKVLNIIKLEAEQSFRHHSSKILREAVVAASSKSDEARDEFMKVIARAETLYGKKSSPINTVFDVLNDPGQLQDLGIKNIDDVAELADWYQPFNARMNREEHVWMSEGIFQSGADKVNYLPTHKKPEGGIFRGVPKEIGAFQPGVRQARQFTWEQTAAQEIAKIKYFFGVKDDNLARQLIGDLSGTTMDFNELIAYRVIAHEKMRARANMIRQFREFGVPVAEFTGPMRQHAMAHGGRIEALGMRTVDDQSLKGLMFDKNVGDIVEKAISVTGPKHIQSFMKATNSFTSWWKGVVTMTTGFHARNFLSNNVTGFLKFGSRWFRIKKYDFPATAATIYAIAKDNPDSLLAKLNFNRGMYERMLNSKHGNYTLRELADYASEKGVISEAVYGFDIPETVGKILKKPSGIQRANPLSQKFIGQDISHKIGSVLESEARFKSFLIDYTDIAKEGADEYALNYGVKEAKKWFIDYTDLSPTEKNVLKKVIPFYSWLRKNISNQISGLAQYPEMYSLFPKLEEFASLDDPNYDPMLIPEWMKQAHMFPIGIPEGGEKGRFTLFRPDIPMVDINKIPLLFEEGGFLPVGLEDRPFFDDIIAAAHPVIKWLAEVVVVEKGYNTFYKENMRPTTRAPYLMQLLARAPGVMTILDGVSRLAGLEKPVIDINDEGRLQIDSKMAQTIYHFMPLLRTIETVGLLGNQVIPGFEEAIEQATGGKDDYDKIETAFQVLTRYLGFKMKTVNMEEEKRKLQEEIYEAAEEERRSRMRGSPQSQVRSNQWQRRRTRDLQRVAPL